MIVNTPDDIVTNTDPGLPTARVTWIRPTVTDNSPSYRMISSHNPGTLFPIGVTTVTYTATDIYNNTGTTSFNVTVIGRCRCILSICLQV